MCHSVSYYCQFITNLHIFSYFTLVWRGLMPFPDSYLLFNGAIMLDVRHCYCRVQANIGRIAEAGRWIRKFVQSVGSTRSCFIPDLTKEASSPVLSLVAQLDQYLYFINQATENYNNAMLCHLYAPSSITICSSRKDPPTPPTSAGMFTPSNPLGGKVF